MSPPKDRYGPQIFLVLLALVGFVALVGGVSRLDDTGAPRPGVGPTGPAPTRPAPTSPAADGAGTSSAAQPGAVAGDAAPPPASTAAPSAGSTTAGTPASTPAVDLPAGGRRVFADHRILVAYYGTAGSGALGVLGEAGPERIMARLDRTAARFGRTGRPVQPVFELIVTIAHAGPTRTGAYSSDIPRRQVQRYLDAAHRHGVLVVLDLQPGRADFLDVARRWRWALQDPWVGLALDPEWRMGPDGVPGRRIGSVSAAEVNRVAAWLDGLTARRGLPQKVFMLHQFRTDMVRHPERIRPREHLALVQHVDGFGTRAEKMATFRRVARPRQFALGFKLFYDEDVHRMGPSRVLAIRPRIDFVSFQ